MNLFVYGELRRPTVLEEQLGRIPPMSPGVVEGFRRRRNEDTGFYEAIPLPGARIVGLVMFDLDAGELAGIDRYEGVDRGMYRRVPVEVEVVGAAGPVAAQMYVAGST